MVISDKKKKAVLGSRKLTFIRVSFCCSEGGDVVKVAQLASITGAQSRIAQTETPVTLQFQGNKFTLSPSQLRQLTTGQPLQLQGTVTVCLVFLLLHSTPLVHREIRARALLSFSLLQHNNTLYLIFNCQRLGMVLFSQSSRETLCPKAAMIIANLANKILSSLMIASDFYTFY